MARQKPFQPKINNKSLKSTSLSSLQKLTGEWTKSQASASTNSFDQTHEKPKFEFELPNKLEKKLNITDLSKAIFCLKFSGI